MESWIELQNHLDISMVFKTSVFKCSMKFLRIKKRKKDAKYLIMRFWRE